MTYDTETQDSGGLGDRLAYQDLSRFAVPHGFRGRSIVIVQLWWLCQAILFRASPQFMYGWRRFLLRLFGARVGKGVLIRPTAVVTYPWKVTLCDHSWIGDDAVLYSLGTIEIGAHAVISQRSYLCAGDHDPARVDFAIRGRSIRIEEQAWVASDVFVAPGVTVGRGAVVGARSSVFSDIEEGMVCVGTPCRPLRRRVPQ
ncbi:MULTISPECIES: putative colanic acid biosynthesis acetyltransferase [Burkholderia]|uniref:putative colanic acid biosynthesis acetyltransferase n=1 Tax=Burkholderia TaxID=32008 RepID=UPI0009B51393|nr:MULTISPECIES: putative colanic acid biosynthesis acetyltransferase [Burkholderia]RQM54666.1 colanic acid biosynthesis acetyltransferase WcaF [Burkholderia vietnamiensis]CAG9203394.1 putative acyl transferase [Burkholderia vietnamiensis]HDR9049588.1 colanic acid biosynthesis acetyltransferase WcaF [Burkholderia vietnamiensis]HDR9234508.1 colanic acid biosynthesis acetyltransferase WcaF [Burkholderia vietnamiensis]